MNERPNERAALKSGTEGRGRGAFALAMCSCRAHAYIHSRATVAGEWENCENDEGPSRSSRSDCRRSVFCLACCMRSVVLGLFAVC